MRAWVHGCCAALAALSVLAAAAPVAPVSGPASSDSEAPVARPVEAGTHGAEGPVLQEAAVRVIATGIPGAGALCQVGRFHLGGPLFGAAAAAPGAILGPERLLVASTSNFGAAKGNAGEPEGSILSIDPTSQAILSVPPTFASAASGQVQTLGGQVRLYTANSPSFLNSVKNTTPTRTLDEPAASLPLGISLNSAFGRPWLANAPFGGEGAGTITVLDADGVPFRGPFVPAGGVFLGDLTNRGDASSTSGLDAAALATALITKSPDGSGRAVFFAALANGAVAQVHVSLGVDDLASAGTFTPLGPIDRARVESTNPDDVVRVGMLFNWVPNLVLYVTDPLADRIVALDLGANAAQTLFTQTTRYLASPWLDRPVDLAPTSREEGARNFASNTTLGGGSDLYVLNRGDNTIARLTQSGQLVARASLDAALSAAFPGARVAGIATSSDGRKIFVTATTPGGGGVVVETDAFGTGAVSAALFASAAAAGAHDAAAQGEHIFSRNLEVGESLGPLLNGRSCLTCHHFPGVGSSPAAGGMGVTTDSFVVRIGRSGPLGFEPFRVPVARQLSIADFGASCGLRTGVPAMANVTSTRSAMTLRGTSLIDTILDAKILAVMHAQPESVRGRPNYAPDGRIGKFGWKAHTPTLVEFMAEAQRDELGLTNPMQRTDVAGCGGNRVSPEADAVPLTSLVAFLARIDDTDDPPPALTDTFLGSPGAIVFSSIGCAACHTPSMPGPGSPAASERPVRLYSDLLLHDMGPDLADGIVQGQATGSEFRTMPLWRVSDRRHFLHDGRAETIPEAIVMHGGQAATAAAAFEALSPSDRQALLEFLNGI